MSESSPTFWSRAFATLAARIPPWQVLALVAGHVALQIVFNAVATKELLLGPLFICQVSLLLTWMSLGRTQMSLRALVPVLVFAMLWMPIEAIHDGSYSILFWPHRFWGGLLLYGEMGLVYGFLLELLSVTVLMQLVLLAAPLALLRRAGLRLLLNGESHVSAHNRWQFSIRQMLLWTATIAISIAVVQSIPFGSVLRFADGNAALYSLFLCAASLLPTAFAVAVFLWTRLSMVWNLSVGLAAFCISWLIWQIPDSSESLVFLALYSPRMLRPGEFAVLEASFGFTWLAPLVFTVVPFISLLLVRSAGYRLVWRPRRSAAGTKTLSPAG